MTTNSLWGILASRLLQGLLVVFLVVSAVFFVSRVTRDPIAFLASDQSTQAEIEALKERFGLNDHVVVQYGRFLWDTVQLDMGRSLLNGRDALGEVSSRVVKTLQLGVASLLFAIVLGLSTGVIAALRRGRPADCLARLLAVFGQAVPDFWLGLMLIFFFSVELGWLPTGGSGSLKHMILPMITMGTFTSAAVMRLTRSGMIDAMDADFVRTARAKGLPERTVVVRHALRHALLPVVTILGIQAGRLIAGALVVETVFAWPGVGRLTIQAIGGGDFPVTQTAILLIAASIVLANIVVDLSYRLVDPRIRAGSA
ncbi:MAG: peptide/nickel transport system permease protein [Chloroflexi bacterium]|jgi:peptide/nickel transport system permease protein|nr:MAG: peptide/nickel transport system permease protein [Chloroflexota bacterium]